MLIFEVVPPFKTTSFQLEQFLNQIVKITRLAKVDAIDIPDLVSEKDLVRKKSRIKPLDFARLIKKKTNLPLIVNRVTVFKSWERQKKWLFRAQVSGVSKVILVGPPDKKKYPGPSVVETAELITKLNQNQKFKIEAGGVTIPHRPEELKRILKKQKAGANFFLSQILWQSRDICCLLKKYHLVCQKNRIKPARILLTFSPVSTKEDLEFLKLLRVKVPLKTKNLLLKDIRRIKDLSITEIQRIIKRVKFFCKSNKIKVSLDLVVTYIRLSNLDTSFKLLKVLKKNDIK